MNNDILSIIRNGLSDIDRYLLEARELSKDLFIKDNDFFDYNDDLKSIYNELKLFGIDTNESSALIVDSIDVKDIYSVYKKILSNMNFLKYNLKVIDPDIYSDVEFPKDFVKQNRKNTIITINSLIGIIKQDIIDLKLKFKNFNLTRVISSYKYLVSNFNFDKYNLKLNLYSEFKENLIFYNQRITKIVDDYNLINDKFDIVIGALATDNSPQSITHLNLLKTDRDVLLGFKLDFSRTKTRFSKYVEEFNKFYINVKQFIDFFKTVDKVNVEKRLDELLLMKTQIDLLEQNVLKLENSLPISDLLDSKTFTSDYIELFKKFRLSLMNNYKEVENRLMKRVYEWYSEFKLKFEYLNMPIPPKYSGQCSNISCILKNYDNNPDKILLKDGFFKDLYHLFNLSEKNDEPDISTIRKILNIFNFESFFSSIAEHIELYNVVNTDLIKLIQYDANIVKSDEKSFVENLFNKNYIILKDELISFVSSLYNDISTFVSNNPPTSSFSQLGTIDPYKISTLNNIGEMEPLQGSYTNKIPLCIYMLESTSPKGITSNYFNFLNCNVLFNNEETQDTSRLYSFNSFYGSGALIEINMTNLVCGLTKEKFSNLNLKIDFTTSVKNSLFPSKSYINPNFYGAAILIGYGTVKDSNKTGFFISTENIDRITIENFVVDNNTPDIIVFMDHEFIEVINKKFARIENVEKLTLTDEYSLYKTQSMNMIYEFGILELMSLAFDERYSNLSINELIGLGITNLNLSNYYYITHNLPQNGVGLTKLYDVARIKKLKNIVKNNFKVYLKAKLQNWIPDYFKYRLTSKNIDNIIVEFNSKYINRILDKITEEINNFDTIIEYERKYTLETTFENMIFVEFNIDSFDYRVVIYQNSTEIDNIKNFFDTEMRNFVKDFTSGSGFMVYEKEFYNKIMSEYYSLYSFCLSNYTEWLNYIIEQGYEIKSKDKTNIKELIISGIFKNKLYIIFDNFSLLKMNFDRFSELVKSVLLDSVSVIIDSFYIDISNLDLKLTSENQNYKNILEKGDDTIAKIFDILKSYSDRLNNINSKKAKFNLDALKYETKITKIDDILNDYNLYSICVLLIPSFEKDWNQFTDILTIKMSELIKVYKKNDNIDIRNFKDYLKELKKKISVSLYKNIMSYTLGQFKEKAQVERNIKDLTLFDFSLLITDYINSYQIPKNIPDVIKNTYPGIFSEQKYSPLPLSAHPQDSESIYQFFRSPRFDNICMMMEDTISQPFNSMHMYFNSNKYKLDKFGGIDNSSVGSSHRTKIIITSNTTGSVSPRASDGAGYITNDVRSGGMHIYTADNFYMTTDREHHNAINGSMYSKVGNNCNILIGSRKNKPAYSTIPENKYESISEKYPPKLNVESRNNINFLSKDNSFFKITSSSPIHIRSTLAEYTKKYETNGKGKIENFSGTNAESDGKVGNIYITVSENLHIVAGGSILCSVNSIENSKALSIKVAGGLTIQATSIAMIGSTKITGNLEISGSLFVGGIIVGIIPACKCGSPALVKPDKPSPVGRPTVAAIAEHSSETKGYAETDPKTKEVSGIGDS